MREHTRKHPTESNYQYQSIEDEGIPGDEVIKQICGDLPEWSIMLSGLRYREGLTQANLAELVGTKQVNISQMEHGKRQIGKSIAKKLADIFKTDYRLFL